MLLNLVRDVLEAEAQQVRWMKMETTTEKCDDGPEAVQLKKTEGGESHSREALMRKNSTDQLLGRFLLMVHLVSYPVNHQGINEPPMLSKCDKQRLYELMTKCELEQQVIAVMIHGSKAT